MTSPVAAAQAICNTDVIAERWRQLKKWGAQRDYADGTDRPIDSYAARAAQDEVDERAKNGTVTWRDVLYEEVREAFAESDRQKLRAELVQVAAVAVAWIEDLDNRAGDRAAVVEPEPVLDEWDELTHRPVPVVPDDLDRFIISVLEPDATSAVLVASVFGATAGGASVVDSDGEITWRERAFA